MVVRVLKLSMTMMIMADDEEDEDNESYDGDDAGDDNDDEDDDVMMMVMVVAVKKKIMMKMMIAGQSVDGTKFLTKSAEDNQTLLDETSEFFEWTPCLKAEPPKCKSLAHHSNAKRQQKRLHVHSVSSGSSFGQGVQVVGPLSQSSQFVQPGISPANSLSQFSASSFSQEVQVVSSASEFRSLVQSVSSGRKFSQLVQVVSSVS